MKNNQNKLDKFFKYVESHIASPIKLIIGLAVVGLSVITYNVLNPPNDIVASSVMITNLQGNSGGTGVIIKSTTSESHILTNAHVCGVVEHGGKVTGQHGFSLMVREYTQSQHHDICLIKVLGDLGVSTSLASSGPNFYYEKALVSGHPSLYPNVVTSGHFSGKSTIQIVTGFRECTAEELASPLGIVCQLIGGLPIIKNYEATLVTATIMPGSSGSGVYNEAGELSGLVFAGSKGLSYAWTVPYESIRFFLDKELRTLVPTIPPSEISIQSLMASQKSWNALKFNCSIKNAIVADYCKFIDSDILWRSE